MFFHPLSMLTSLLCLAFAGSSSAQLTLENGNAEAGPGGDGSTVIVPPGWTASGDATVVLWSTPGWMNSSDPGPADRGLNYFAGGPGMPSTSFEQTVDVSALATDIDAGLVTYDLNGWLGGWENQGDYAVVHLTFMNTAGLPNGTDQIGPVSSADRGGLTGLQERNTIGVLPAGTRGVEVVLRFTRIEGSFNDGYADSITLLIKHTGGPTLSVTTLTAGSTATLTIAHGSANGLVQIGYSLAGGGPTSTPFGTVLLSQPIVILTSLSLDANGDGNLPVNVPIAAVGRTVWIQALDQNVGLSNGLMEFIL